MKTIRQQPSAELSQTLDTLKIHQDLKTRFIGRSIYLFTELDSTNQAALYLNLHQPPTDPRTPQEGALILAESQTQGKGRLGRHWVSPPGVNLYASFILRPTIEAPQAPLLTGLAAVCVARAIEALSRLKPTIKWPNDIMIQGKKTAGILTEASIRREKVDYLILGIGINVNLDIDTLPQDIRPNATSLAQQLGHPVDRNKLIAMLCNEMETAYLEFLNEGSDPILKTLRSLTETLGKKVRVQLPHRNLVGWAEDLNTQGALIIRTIESQRETVYSGDIIHLRNEDA